MEQARQELEWALYEKDKTALSLALVRTKGKKGIGNEQELKRAVNLMQTWLQGRNKGLIWVQVVDDLIRQIKI